MGRRVWPELRPGKHYNQDKKDKVFFEHDKFVSDRQSQRQILANKHKPHLVGAPSCVEPVFKLLPEQVILRLDVIPVPTELKQGLDDSLALEQGKMHQMLSWTARKHRRSP